MTVIASKAEQGQFQTRLVADNARWLADADAGAGGAGEYPDPHQLLDAALAACTAITLRMYAERKGIKLDDVEVKVSHVEANGVYRMERSISLIGELTDAERARLLEIADRCPVHKSLSSRIEIVAI